MPAGRCRSSTSPTFDSENGFTYGANLTWNPTGLTSVRLDGEGGFEPSDVGSSRLESEIGLRVDHELLRNLLIGGEVRYSRDDFQDANRVDNRIDVGPDITYFINRNFSVGASYVFTKRQSDESEREFDRNVITLEGDRAAVDPQSPLETRCGMRICSPIVDMARVGFRAVRVRSRTSRRLARESRRVDDGLASANDHAARPRPGCRTGGWLFVLVAAAALPEAAGAGTAAAGGALDRGYLRRTSSAPAMRCA